MEKRGGAGMVPQASFRTRGPTSLFVLRRPRVEGPPRVPFQGQALSKVFSHAAPQSYEA